MISIHGKSGRLCDTPSRRELLTIGSLSLVGLSLPDMLRLQAKEQAGAKNTKGIGRAKSVILLYLQGSPSHIDTWDPKPNAPVGIRGEFKPIASRVPGMQVSEVLPLLAKEADKFSLVRSIGVKPRGLANHGAAIYMLLTAHDPTNFTATGLAVPPSREDLPSVGAVVARYKPVEARKLGYVAVCGPVREGSVVGVGQGAGLLGGTFNPLQMYEDPTQPLRLDAFALPADVTLGRMKARMDLRTAVGPGQATRANEFDHFYGKALSLLESSQSLGAFKLDKEASTLRDRYGRTKFGQSCLLARRLVEAGTRFIQVTWPAGSDTEPAPGPDGSWDTHRNNFPMLRDWRCPVFDRAVSSLLQDLSERGLLDETLVVAVGEFGRSPKIGSPTTNNVGPGGRDHWPDCYTCLISGGGIKNGQVYGESDKNGAYPKSGHVHPYNLIATIHHALGIDPNLHYPDTLDRPRRLVEHGDPIWGLF